jgi:hypothetical protein
VFAPVLLSSIARSGSAQEQYAVSSRPLYETGENGKLKQRSGQQFFSLSVFIIQLLQLFQSLEPLLCFRELACSAASAVVLALGDQSSKHER